MLVGKLGIFLVPGAFYFDSAEEAAGKLLDRGF